MSLAEENERLRAEIARYRQAEYDRLVAENVALREQVTNYRNEAYRIDGLARQIAAAAAEEKSRLLARIQQLETQNVRRGTTGRISAISDSSSSN